MSTTLQRLWKSCEVCGLQLLAGQRGRHHTCDPDTLVGKRCTCPPGCTDTHWGNGPRDCKDECDPCRIMAGSVYISPKKAAATPGEPTEQEPQRQKAWLTDSYKTYLTTDAWQLVRSSALARAGYKCQRCNATGELHAHHLNYHRLGSELPTDIAVLCNECHATEHRRIDHVRLENRRLDGFATKKWGEYWWETIDEDYAQEVFDEWLERREA